MHRVLHVMILEEGDPSSATRLAATMKADHRIADWTSTALPPRLAIVLKFDTSELQHRTIIREFNDLGFEVIEHR